jgi:hypothetical protein
MVFGAVFAVIQHKSGSGLIPKHTFLRAVIPMMTKMLAVLSLAALPFHSVAHDEYSNGSMEIDFYSIELSPNEKLKMSHLQIYSENESHDDEGANDNSLPSPPQHIINDDPALILL